MTHGWSAKLWIESAVAAASGLLALATLIWREWIELVFRVDPDGGSGALEWGLTLALAAIALLTASMAWWEWRRAKPASA